MVAGRLVRLAGVVAVATLAIGVPAAGVTRDLVPGPVTLGGAGVAGCSTSGLHLSYELAAGSAAITAVVIADAPASCLGRRVEVTVGAAGGDAVIVGPGTRVLLDAPVDAVEVTQVALRLVEHEGERGALVVSITD